uniref:E199L homolog protein n=1 Tax=Abalone asfa-like virus TaxID=2839893 RepID=A0A5K7XX15_9VIRU|nr:E199L homolog protein [Abalone asfa-like virus]BCY04610.1 hypothetical protein [Abalone asfa-like virus]
MVKCNVPHSAFGEFDPGRFKNLQNTDPAALVAIKNSAAGRATEVDDLVIGNVCQGTGFCADPANAETYICGCVNSHVPLPHCSFGPCAGSSGAYIPKYLKNIKCPEKIVVCNSTIYDKSTGVGDVSAQQTLNCSGAADVKNITIETSASLVFGAIFIIVMIFLILKVIFFTESAPKPILKDTSETTFAI